MNLRIAIAQINTTVGDLKGNAAKVLEYAGKAALGGADMVVFPELALTGYPPEDLLHKEKFIEDNLAALKEVSRGIGDIIAVVGYVGRKGPDITNSAAVIYKGEVKGSYDKMLLPNYGVFDEDRYFIPGLKPVLFRVGEVVFGINICEDIWHKNGPVNLEADEGAGLVININASPYHCGKTGQREKLVKERAVENSVSIVYANLVGGQDELVFDGQSMVVDQSGSILYRACAFDEELLLADIETPEYTGIVGNAVTVCDSLAKKAKPAIAKRTAAPLKEDAEIYSALITGLKDYTRKNGFGKVAIGLSGGVDSALVAALASDAIGKDNVTCVFMPTRYSSDESRADAAALAGNLGVNFLEISIEDIFKVYLETLEPVFAGKPVDITEENLQARIRGNILMALSNKFGWLVLTTGNKSEMSTGYATLYGDMAGGFAVIKDVPKTLVYRLSAYRNSISHVIPDRIMTKAPTAELKFNQKDQDTLPPYDTLDKILKEYVEEDKDVADIIRSGFDKDTVLKVSRMVDSSEYKRRQSPPGVKITPKAFGKDRRMPITNRYK